jgi:hypothetical protein
MTDYTDREQKLVDMCFDIAMHTYHGFKLKGHNTRDDSYDGFDKMTQEEFGAWVARQLRIMGFDTQPMGISWGVLKK